MTVQELIAELQKFNPEANVSVITIGKQGDWEYTQKPKLTSHKNMFGETVFIR